MKRVILILSAILVSCATTTEPVKVDCSQPHEIVISGERDLRCAQVGDINGYIKVNNCISQSGKTYRQLIINPTTVVFINTVQECRKPMAPRRPELRFEDMQGHKS